MALSVAINKFPGVEWTGWSSIHVSLARGGDIDITDPKQVIHIMKKLNFAGKIWRLLQDKFAPFSEWIIPEQAFAYLVYVDCWRHMNGQPDSSSQDKLQNPITGNYFHRIALVDDLVGGIRFWCDPCGDGFEFGFRFRIEKQNEAEEKTRDRTLATVASVTEEMEELDEIIFDVAEPPATKVAVVEHLMELI